jgi:hypothetical protein
MGSDNPGKVIGNLPIQPVRLPLGQTRRIIGRSQLPAPNNEFCRAFEKSLQLPPLWRKVKQDPCGFGALAEAKGQLEPEGF